MLKKWKDELTDYEKEILVDPAALKLAQGEVDLFVQAWDYSRRRGGDGNRTLIQHKFVVDTIPPAIRPVSRMHNVNVGGSGLIVYQTSSDALESGVFVNELFFPGFLSGDQSSEGICVCFFAVPPQESREIRFAYELPSSILEKKDDAHHYSLLIQKQAGTKALPVQVTVELPPGVELATAEPEPSTVEGNVVRYQLSLSTDRQIEFSYHQLTGWR